MKRAVLNYWVDMIIGVAFLFCAVTGIVRLFPEATTLSAAGAPTILGVSSALWATIHDWSGVVMAAGVGVHTVLHLRWLTHMTRKLAGGSRKKRVARERPATAGVVATGAAGSLARLEHMGTSRRTGQPRRMDRKAFLAGSALVGGVALLGGLAIAGRKAETSTAGETTVSESAPESARVAVDSGRCTGCGDCLQVCPHGVFSFDGSKAVAGNPDACTLCGRCLQVCQTSAITLNG